MSSLLNEAVVPVETDEQTSSDSHQLRKYPSLAETSPDADAITHSEIDSISQVLAISTDRAAVVDRNGRCLYTNPAMQEFCDISDSESKSRIDAKTSRFNAMQSGIFNNLTDCLRGESKSDSIIIEEKDNTSLAIDLELIPYRNANGDVNACIVTVRDDDQTQSFDKHDADDFNVDLISQRFLSALDFFSGAFALYDQDDRKLVFNKTFKDIHKFLGDHLRVGMTFQECIRFQVEQGLTKVPDGQAEEFIANRTHRFHNPSGPFEVQKPGNKWYRVTEQRLDDGGCLQTMEDISEMKMAEIALRTSEQRFKEFAETAAELFWETDECLKFSYLSGRYEELTGDNPDSILGCDLRELESVRADEQIHSRLNLIFENRSAFEDIVIRYGATEADFRYFSFSGRPRFDDSETFVGYRGIARDITESRKLTDQLHYLARHDSLTQLMNRREFNEQIARVQKDVRIRNSPATLGFIDLDQFKIVNDTEGHPAGDQLLKELSAFLISKLRSDDVLARLGGDEFGLLLENCNIHDGKIIVEKLMSTLRDFNFSYNDRMFGVTASVGLVEINDNNASLEDLIRQVDIACYAAKDLGRNQIHVYDQSDYEVKKRSQEILHASGIQQAITQDRFILYAQPIASSNVSQGEFDHYEILLRMLDDEDNELTPASFIPVAERYRLMADIDRWVIRNTLKALKEAPASFESTHFTINLSGGSFSDATLVDDILIEFENNNIAPERIIFEITETAVVSSVERACEFIDRLTRTGCRFAIDDFGSGLSSFSYLKRFEAQFLKIDGSLILEIATDSDDRNMVAAINQMAHVLGMQTIAEFVENQDIVDVLADIGVDMLQGYGIGKPAPLAGILSSK